MYKLQIVEEKCATNAQQIDKNLLRKNAKNKFHSFIFMHKSLIFNVLKDETYWLQCFIFGFNVSFLCFNISFSKHGARDLKPWCKRDQTLVQEMQNEGMKSKVKLHD